MRSSVTPTSSPGSPIQSQAVRINSLGMIASSSAPKTKALEVATPYKAVQISFSGEGILSLAIRASFLVLRIG
jgi:hypothetical protein